MITDDFLRITCNQGVSSGDSSRFSRFIDDVDSNCGNGSTSVSGSSEIDDAI